MMEKKIDRLLRLLKIEFAVTWVVIICLIAGYENGILEEGTLIGNSRAVYIAQLTGVLLAICLIPMSLRIFNLSLTKYIRNLEIDSALKSYRRWSEVRIILLLVVAVFNISLYYWTMGCIQYISVLLDHGYNGPALRCNGSTCLDVLCTG